MFRKENNDSHNEERYQFMREQVKPQKRKQLHMWTKRMVVLATSACVFGVIAGGIICLMTNLSDEKTTKKSVVKINTYDTSAPATSIPQGDASLGGSSKSKLTMENLNHMSEQLAAVGEKVQASLVGVQNNSDARDWFSEKQNNSKNVTFGLIYKETTDKFYIATTYNVVKAQHTVKVQLVDETMVEGKVLGSDTTLNVAVVSVSKSKIKKETKKKLQVATLGRANIIRNGSNVVAVGCPNGVLYSVMTGRVSNSRLYGSIPDGEVKLFCTDIPYTEDGNGVILDTSGNVVGMITKKFTIETGTAGLGFVDMSNVSTVLELLRHKQDVAFMGIEGESINATAASAHDLRIGAYVKNVYAQAPAYQAGMRVADIITEIDGVVVTGMTDIYNTLLQHNAEDVIECTISRKSGNKYVTKKLKVKLE